jgi:DNA processing protein
VASDLLPRDHPSYPAGLEPIGQPLLYLRGRLPSLPGVAVVGTRKPTPEACAFAATLARDLVRGGFAVWSGGATGIDAVAHEAALDAGGVTVLVPGGGLDEPYPRHHGPLFDRVVRSGGALLARVPDGTKPMAPWFHQRNALLAAATSATVVVQAGIISGARSTAAAARRFGRPLCVVPHAPWDERGAGCAEELAMGAQAVVSVREVLLALGRPPPAPRPGRGRGPTTGPSVLTLPLALGAPPRDLSPEESAIVAVLGDAPLHVDEVCERTGLSAHVVTRVLLTLTLGAIVVEAPPGFVRQLSRHRGGTR